MMMMKKIIAAAAVALAVFSPMSEGFMLMTAVDQNLK